MSKIVIRRKSAKKGFIKGQKGLAGKIALVDQMAGGAKLPLFRAGDTLRVHVRIKEGEKERTQAYEGLCIAIRGAGGSQSFNVRKMSHGVGVERIFLFNSPKVAKVDVLEQGKVRRAKLYYIRELEGRAAKIEREMETTVQSAASEAAKTAKK